MTTKTRQPLAIYAASPADVAGTLRAWARGERDPLEISETYSGQFFDAVERLGWRARVITHRGEHERCEARGIIVEHRASRAAGQRGWRYRLGRLADEVGVLGTVLRERADVLVLAFPLHWWVFAPARWAGTRVIASVHNTFWIGEAPKHGSVLDRLSRRLDGWFFRSCVDESLCISGVIAEQVERMAGGPRGPVRVCLPRFDVADFEGLPAATQGPPLRVLFAGRVIRAKGCMLMLDAAERIERERPREVQWDVVGDGADAQTLRAEARARELDGLFRLHGHVDRQTLRGFLARAGVVCAPTTSAFNEGLHKGVLEAALAGRPCVTTSVVPGGVLVGEAATVVPADDAAALASAVLALRDDAGLFARRVAGGRAFRDWYAAADHTWGVALLRAMNASGHREDVTARRAAGSGQPSCASPSDAVAGAGAGSGEAGPMSRPRDMMTSASSRPTRS
ncbi:MAG: glycosyltransferase family 4 protein [Phycisphaerae bacterium]|nr:glycosyltransferase family 4 protein [Phycisphaerae bacterium]